MSTTLTENDVYKVKGSELMAVMILRIAELAIDFAIKVIITVQKS